MKNIFGLLGLSVLAQPVSADVMFRAMDYLSSSSSTGSEGPSTSSGWWDLSKILMVVALAIVVLGVAGAAVYFKSRESRDYMQASHDSDSAGADSVPTAELSAAPAAEAPSTAAGATVESSVPSLSSQSGGSAPLLSPAP